MGRRCSSGWPRATASRGRGTCSGPSAALWRLGCSTRAARGAPPTRSAPRTRSPASADPRSRGSADPLDLAALALLLPLRGDVLEALRALVALAGERDLLRRAGVAVRVRGRVGLERGLRPLARDVMAAGDRVRDALALDVARGGAGGRASAGGRGRERHGGDRGGGEGEARDGQGDLLRTGSGDGPSLL